jgi:hypothetical protein
VGCKQLGDWSSNLLRDNNDVFDIFAWEVNKPFDPIACSENKIGQLLSCTLCCSTWSSTETGVGVSIRGVVIGTFKADTKAWSRLEFNTCDGLEIFWQDGKGRDWPYPTTDNVAGSSAASVTWPQLLWDFDFEMSALVTESLSETLIVSVLAQVEGVNVDLTLGKHGAMLIAGTSGIERLRNVLGTMEYDPEITLKISSEEATTSLSEEKGTIAGGESFFSKDLPEMMIAGLESSATMQLCSAWWSHVWCGVSRHISGPLQGKATTDFSFLEERSFFSPIDLPWINVGKGDKVTGGCVTAFGREKTPLKDKEGT